MVTKKKWFKKAVNKKAPYTLGGWSARQTLSIRRLKALSSRPKNWTRRHKYLSVARALQALSNVTKLSYVRITARADATYFFNLVKRIDKNELRTKN